jgi:hypothetical protein
MGDFPHQANCPFWTRFWFDGALQVEPRSVTVALADSLCKLSKSTENLSQGGWVVADYSSRRHGRPFSDSPSWPAEHELPWETSVSPCIAIHLVLQIRQVKLVATYLAHTRPLIESYLTECLSGGFPVLMARDLNAHHTDWSSRQTTDSGTLLREYASVNSCLIYRSDSWTTALYAQNANTRSP